MQPNQPIDPNQGQPQSPTGDSSIPPMMLVQILKAIQPFIQKMVVMEVQKALQGQQGQDQQDVNNPNPATPGLDQNGQPLE